MSLSSYHQKYLNIPDAEIQNRANEKKEELFVIFNQIQLKIDSKIARIAILKKEKKNF